MQLLDVDVRESPLSAGRVRLNGVVSYDDTGVTEDYWFDVPLEHEAMLSTSGNPWLACLLPLAATLGQPLRVPLPVDRPLLENADRLMRIWQAWYPELTVVPIEANAAEVDGADGPRRCAAFFSGGVDSFFTLLRPRDTAPPIERTPIQDLITVWGFDIPLDRAASFERMRSQLSNVGQELGKPVIDVATNLRSTRWGAARWSYVAHGAGLASVGLALEERFQTIYIAGGGGYRGLHPWGSHSVTDPLFSTWRTAIVYDAVSYLRTEKVERICAVPTVQRTLHVCYEKSSDENCGECNKCRRTMLTLETCNVLHAYETFPRRTIDLEQIAAMDCTYFADFREFQDIRALAVARGRTDVVRAIDRALKRARMRIRLREGKDILRDSLATIHPSPRR
jgi:hypothetical protein